jgi:hypothetical protein
VFPHALPPAFAGLVNVARVYPAFRLRLHAGLYSVRLLRRLKVFLVLKLTARAGAHQISVATLPAGSETPIPTDSQTTNHEVCRVRGWYCEAQCPHPDDHRSRGLLLSCSAVRRSASLLPGRRMLTVAAAAGAGLKNTIKEAGCKSSPPAPAGATLPPAPDSGTPRAHVASVVRSVRAPGWSARR